MTCPICVHPQREEIDANRAHLSLRQLERQYQVSRSSLGRHQQRCQQPSQAPQASGEPVQSPAPPSNPLAASHGEAQRLYDYLTTTTQPLDARQLGIALARVLVQLTAAPDHDTVRYSAIPMARNGTKTGGGSRKGKPNKATVGIRELARSFVDDPEYRAALRQRLVAGEAGALETIMWSYAYGKPVALSEDGRSLPVDITITF